ncbi:MAG: hypothetical protein OMM_11660 [Candidatus Magnetoglobus multicellularis str. Araruama]|uniref:Uncharacterized protein n=1 Tax=Candidatus Magnetoglobus multicellularis str. Araruama TaxID=890399 RepID=A0A1V1NXP4_9BACT|nr:MAG: hypothetical protein OMM_11660 [Candidatus Magnetoglobus multicellularis str. Araruama]
MHQDLGNQFDDSGNNAENTFKLIKNESLQEYYLEKGVKTVHSNPIEDGSASTKHANMLNPAMFGDVIRRLTSPTNPTKVIDFYGRTFGQQDISNVGAFVAIRSGKHVYPVTLESLQISTFLKAF